MSLSPKQTRFVAEYLVDLNATQAAIRAGYSERTARSMGAENLTKPDIAEAIRTAMDARSERTEITQDRVLREFAKVGFFDIRRIFTPGGALLSPKEMDDDTAAAVQAVEVVERPRRNEDGEVEIEHVRKVKLNDKLTALTQIGRHLGMFTDKHEHEHSGPNKGPIQYQDLTDEELERRIAKHLGEA